MLKLHIGILFQFSLLWTGVALSPPDVRGVVRSENSRPLDVPWLSGLAALPDSHSPYHASWSNSIAICAVMKDENATDVIEWLRYYRWLGVDHVVLYDNGSVDRAFWQALALRFSSNFLSLRAERSPHAQLKVYAHCMAEQRRFYNWLAFLDLDEFLVLREQRSTSQTPPLKAFLNLYKTFGGLSVHWIFVGPSGHRTRPPSGGVLCHYTRCVPEPTARVKTIANTFYLEGNAVHPHNHEYRDGKFAVNERYAPVRHIWRPTPATMARNKAMTFHDCLLNTTGCFLVPGWRYSPPSTRRVALFHYATKSHEDFVAKQRRGSGMSYATKTVQYLRDIERAETDDAVCKIPATLADACCQLDNVSI